MASFSEWHALLKFPFSHVLESLSRTLFHALSVILGSALKNVVSCSQCDFGFCFEKDCLMLSV